MKSREDAPALRSLAQWDLFAAGCVANSHPFAPEAFMTHPKPGQLFTGPALYEPYSPWGVIGALVATAVATGIAVLAFFAAIAAWSAMGVSEVDIDQKAAAWASLAQPEGVALTAATQMISLVALWLFARRGGRTAEVLQLSRPGPGWPTYLIGGLLLITITGALEYIMYTATKMDIFADTGWLREGLSSPYWWGTALIAVVLAPLWEELAFRGFLLSALAQTRLGFWGAAVISNTLWTMLHWGYSAPGLISVFVAGLIFSWLVWRTGSIKTPIVAHAIGNAAALVFTSAFGPSA
jgi:uncharacterized protein